MKGRIFLREPSGELSPLDECPYDSEDLLQGYLEAHPDLLAGYQMNEAAPRRWLFVRREHVVEDTAGANRWAVDHVFVDQDSIPTLVEVKRCRDTRIRREVVGQLLEYGANAIAHWPAGTLRASFEARCEAEEWDALEGLQANLGTHVDPDGFWDLVEENLRSGRVRLLFAADRIPPDLQRIVEFLNEQMNPAEVLALEVRQFVGHGRQTLVPRILGSTMSAPDRKTAAKTRSTPWTSAEFVQRLEDSGHTQEAQTAHRLLDWAQSTGLKLEGGSGGKTASVSFVVEAAGLSQKPFSLYEGYGSGGLLQVQLDEMGSTFAAGTSPRQKLCAMFGQIPAVECDPGKSYPGIYLNRLTDLANLELALATMQRAVEVIRSGTWA